MQKDRFEYVCTQAEAGQDLYVTHPDTQEQGMVTGCVRKTEHLLVEMPNQKVRSWDYHDCQEMSQL